MSSLLALLAIPRGQAAAERTRAAANADLTGIVTDTTNGQPLQSAEISVAGATGGIVSNTTTDAFGRFTVHNLSAGAYTVSVHLLGFRPLTRPLTIGTASAAQQMSFAMTPIGLESRGGADHRDRPDLARHAHWRSGVQAERLSRRADEHDVADPAAIDRRRGASADRRSAHSRTARRVHLLRRRCPRARRHLRLAQRAVRSRGRQPDQLPDRRMGRRVRRQERGGRERHDEDSVGRISRRGRAVTSARTTTRRPSVRRRSTARR